MAKQSVRGCRYDEGEREDIVVRKGKSPQIQNSFTHTYLHLGFGVCKQSKKVEHFCATFKKIIKIVSKYSPIEEYY